jgi:hypothetical protein
VADFDAEIARINRLIEAGKLDEAIRAVDALMETSGGEIRARLAEERARLAQSAARKRAAAGSKTATPKP